MWPGRGVVRQAPDGTCLRLAVAKHHLPAWPACATSEAARVVALRQSERERAAESRIWHDGRFR